MHEQAPTHNRTMHVRTHTHHRPTRPLTCPPAHSPTTPYTGDGDGDEDDADSGDADLPPADVPEHDLFYMMQRRRRDLVRYLDQVCARVCVGGCGCGSGCGGVGVRVFVRDLGESVGADTITHEVYERTYTHLHTHTHTRTHARAPPSTRAQASKLVVEQVLVGMLRVALRIPNLSVTGWVQRPGGAGHASGRWDAAEAELTVDLQTAEVLWRNDDLKPVPDSMSEFHDYEALFGRAPLHCGLVVRQTHRHWVHVVGTDYDLIEWDEPDPKDHGVGAPVWRPKPDDDAAGGGGGAGAARGQGQGPGAPGGFWTPGEGAGGMGMGMGMDDVGMDMDMDDMGMPGLMPAPPTLMADEGTHTHTHARTRARTHTHTHTHTAPPTLMADEGLLPQLVSSGFTRHTYTHTHTPAHTHTR